MNKLSDRRLAYFDEIKDKKQNWSPSSEYKNKISSKKISLLRDPQVRELILEFAEMVTGVKYVDCYNEYVNKVERYE